MKVVCRKSRVESRTARKAARYALASGARPSPFAPQLSHAFTLIEVMVVVGIMAIILAAGIPTLYSLLHKGGMRKATADIVEILSHARARAILSGSPVNVMFRPLEGRLEIEGGGGGGAAPEGEGGGGPGGSTSGSASGAQMADDIMIEMLDINLLEYRESDWARVRFYPNGTSDELTLILRSSQNEWKKISLEVTTGLASVDNVIP